MWSCLGWLVGAGRGGCARCWVVFSVCSSSGRAVRTVAGMARPAVCVQDGGACCPHGAGGGGLVRGGAGARAAATSGQALAAARPGRRRAPPALPVRPRVGLG